MNDLRLMDLEMRLAHQDRTIADLNDMITAQWKKIDLLESHLRRMREEFDNLDFGAKGPEPKPPHY